MSYPDPEVRLAGMFLSVYSVAITRPMSSGIFSSLKRHLVHLHTDTDVNFRSEILGYTQKLFDRLRASSATLAKSAVKADRDKASRLAIPKASFNHSTVQSQNDALIKHLEFVVWYIRFLVWELRSTASYQRRIIALQALTIVLRSSIDPGIPQSHLSKSALGQLNWAHGVQMATPQLTRVLMDLIVDPFDDIRNSAVSVLQLCSVTQLLAADDTVPATLRTFLQRGEALQVQTGRADQADGVARAYSLLISPMNEHAEPSDTTTFTTSYLVFEYLTDQLRSTLSYAFDDLAKAVNGWPVHSIFASLKFVCL
jgi:hypothetical protein